MNTANKTTDLIDLKKEDLFILEAIAARIVDRDILFPEKHAAAEKFLAGIDLDEVERLFNSPR